MFSAEDIADLLDKDGKRENKDPFVISPKPDTDWLREHGGASVDLRLGTWFLTKKASKYPLVDVYDEQAAEASEYSVTDQHYIPFGSRFIVHPSSFVLATTLEWVRVPLFLAAMITGKSSWGRRGLIIETAPGVHPGFSGCLTLEITNVGEVPIVIEPGTPICQLSLFKLEGVAKAATKSGYLGHRQPILGEVKLDEFFMKLKSGRTAKGLGLPVKNKGTDSV